jgi:hypothetical protein
MKKLLLLLSLIFNLAFANDGIIDRYDFDKDNDGINDRYDNDMDNDGITDRYDNDRPSIIL